MFGPAGHLYVYFTYGMHHCANIVCGPDGVASAVLLRAGEIVAGEELARSRRPTSKSPKDLASGPARLATALGITTADSGRDALGGPVPAGTSRRSRLPDVSSGPRVGVSGAGRHARLPLALLAERRSRPCPATRRRRSAPGLAAGRGVGAAVVVLGDRAGEDDIVWVRASAGSHAASWNGSRSLRSWPPTISGWSSCSAPAGGPVPADSTGGGTPAVGGALPGGPAAQVHRPG